MDEHLLSRLRHPAYVTPALPAGVLILDHTEVRRDMAEAADEIERLRAALSALLVEYVAGRKEGHIDSFPATAKKVVADARHALNIHNHTEKDTETPAAG